MAIYDVYLTRLAAYVADLRQKGRLIREIDFPSDSERLLEGLPVKVGPGANPGIILRGDTFAEMGNPDAGSSAFLFWTDNPALVRDGRITLIGPDIPESAGASLPFGQVLIMAGAELSERDHQKLEHTQFIADRIEGYMIRSTSQLVWSRVSRDAAEKGFRFETLGRALMAIFRQEVPGVEAMEVLFVTSSREDLEPLEDIAAQVRKIYKSILAADWKAKGFDAYVCSYGGDCRTCPDQTVCDEIKEFVKVRKVKASGSEEPPDS
jgi:CO dehydrogenase/acetyl-CoA synthase beta subunit